VAIEGSSSRRSVCVEWAAFGRGVTCLADLDYLIYYSGTYIMDDAVQTAESEHENRTAARRDGAASGRSPA
jgi:hypothetical protein